MDNLVLLCSAHHRLLHHGAFRIVVEDDGLVFVSRDGEVIEPALRPQFPATFPPMFPRKRDRLADDAWCAPLAIQAGGRRAEHRR